jgi:anti-sigma factor RsiW
MNRPILTSEELLSAYLDGELTADQRREVEQSLAGNAGHRQLLDELRGLHAQLAQLPKFHLGDDFTARVLREVGRRTFAPTPSVPESEYTEEVLSAYLDGEASPDQRRQVEAWLAASPDHQQVLDDLHVLSANLRDLPRYRLDEGFADRVLQAAQQRSLAAQPVASAAGAPRIGRPATVWRRVALVALAVSAAILVTLHWAWGPGREPVEGPGMARTGDEPHGVTPSDPTRRERPSAVPATGDPQRLPEPYPPPAAQLAVEGDSPASPAGRAPSPISFVSLVQPQVRQRLLLVYELSVTAEGAENAAFASLLKRQNIRFQETVAVGAEEQKALLKQRFLKGVEVVRGERTNQDEVQLFLVSCSARQAEAMYAELLTRPFGFASFCLNLTAKDADGGALGRVCDARPEAAEAVQLLVNFAILSRRARQVGVFGKISWVEPSLLTPPPQAPRDPAAVGPLPSDRPAAPGELEGDFRCELLFVVRQLQPLGPDKTPDGQ